MSSRQRVRQVALVTFECDECGGESPEVEAAEDISTIVPPDWKFDAGYGTHKCPDCVNESLEDGIRTALGKVHPAYEDFSDVDVRNGSIEIFIDRSVESRVKY